MHQDQLNLFLGKHKLTPEQLADLIGLTKAAVHHWMTGRRSIAKPYGRLLRLFDRMPNLMKEFT